MEVEAAGEFAGGGQALAGCEVVAEDAEDDLGDELFADGDVASAGEPELHASYLSRYGSETEA